MNKVVLIALCVCFSSPSLLAASEADWIDIKPQIVEATGAESAPVASETSVETRTGTSVWAVLTNFSSRVASGLLFLFR